MPEPYLKKVISASRRLDLVACFPDETAEILATKCPPEKVHSVVLWTKDPTHLLKGGKLRRQLELYDQLFVHFTVTGMGGTRLEPNVLPATAAMKMLPDLLNFVGHPERIRFRFDPVVHLMLPEQIEFTNLFCFEEFTPELARLGILNVSVSWMSVYGKVRSRLARYGYQIIPLTPERQNTDLRQLQTLAERFHLKLHFCSVPGLPVSRCVDGTLLSALHPRGEKCVENRAKGQRKLCGCTASWDVGWYFPCPHGCLYCYANPKEI
jgi:hypothetical protein